jgi:hypothetical protein
LKRGRRWSAARCRGKETARLSPLSRRRRRAAVDEPVRKGSDALVGGPGTEPNRVHDPPLISVGPAQSGHQMRRCYVAASKASKDPMGFTLRPSVLFQPTTTSRTGCRSFAGMSVPSIVFLERHASSNVLSSAAWVGWPCGRYRGGGAAAAGGRVSWRCYERLSEVDEVMWGLAERDLPEI